MSRDELLSTLEERESNEWKLHEPVERIWAGEGNADLLLKDLDEHDPTFISSILEALEEQE